MIGELALFSLASVAVLSSLISVHHAVMKWRYHSFNAELVITVTRITALLSIFSLVGLAALFLSDQFQFLYVSSHSNSALPQFYKLAAVWGGHQGSMLFWVMTLAGWAGCISFIRRCSTPYLTDVLWIMHLLIAAFAWFTLLASNPFELNTQWLSEGRDLNPMLQDVGLIFHPPLLYLGYIGYSVVLAFACAALLQPSIEHQWVEYCHHGAITAWVFLTGGIVLGSWWAYYELGWGGWWFWDPVENASLLPWLTGTALIHALVAARHHKMLRVTALSLAFITFSLSILGTFVVRSGVLTSVHAFAVDPGKGVALLGILVAVLIGSFGLLIYKSEHIVSSAIKSIFSRSYFVLVSIGLLVIATFSVFLGTFYPMVYELAGLGSISVGAPYFNTLFVPLTLLALLLMGAAPLLKWRNGIQESLPRIMVMLSGAIVVGTACYWLIADYIDVSVLIVWWISVWVVITHLVSLMKNRDKMRLFGVTCAHIGIALMAVGASMNAEHSYETNRKLAPSSEFIFGEWAVKYQDTQWYVGPNYTAERSEITFTDKGSQFTVYPERRHYPVRVMNMSEPAIKILWHGDYYVTLAEKVDKQAYAVKVQYKSSIRWVWLGAIICMIGCTGSIVQRMKQEKYRYASV